MHNFSCFPCDFRLGFFFQIQNFNRLARKRHFRAIRERRVAISIAQHTVQWTGDPETTVRPTFWTWRDLRLKVCTKLQEQSGPISRKTRQSERIGGEMLEGSRARDANGRWSTSRQRDRCPTDSRWEKGFVLSKNAQRNVWFMFQIVALHYAETALWISTNVKKHFNHYKFYDFLHLNLNCTC